MANWTTANLSNGSRYFGTGDSQFDSDINVVFIMIDDAGHEVFPFGPSPPGFDAAHNPVDGPTGNRIKVQTPTLTSWVADGVLCENFFVSPVCSPTRTSFQSGQYCFRHGLGHVVRKDHSAIEHWPNPDEITLLPTSINEAKEADCTIHRLLQTKNIRTAWVGKTHQCLNITDPNGDDDLFYQAGNTVSGGGNLGGTGFNQWMTTVPRPDWYRALYSNPSSDVNDLGYSPIVLDTHTPTGGGLHDEFPSTKKYKGYYNWVLNNNGSFENGGAENWWLDSNPGGDSLSRKQMEDALDFINDASTTGQFFVQLWFNAPHGPYQQAPYANVVSANFKRPTNPLTLGVEYGTPSAELTAGWDYFDTTHSNDPDYLSQTVHSNWMGMIEEVDTLLGELFANMNTAKRDKTVFVFCCDNGSPDIVWRAARSPLPTTYDIWSPFEADNPPGNDPAGDPWGGWGDGKTLGTTMDDWLYNVPDNTVPRFKQGIHRTGVGSPLIFYAEPGTEAATALFNGTSVPRTEKALCSIQDLYRTISDIMGVSVLDNGGFSRPVDSHSLRPVLIGEATETSHTRQNVLVEYFTPCGDPSEIPTAALVNYDETAVGDVSNAIRDRGYYHWVAGQGLFKLHRTERNGLVDTFYKIYDVNWNEVDYWEETALVGDPNEATVRTAMENLIDDNVNP